MIKTERAYKEAVEKLKQDKKFIKDQRKKFEEMGLDSEHIELKCRLVTWSMTR
ncbi:MAG TPA: hypothetical protein VFT51_05745 [Bacillales bacterium]|nr:hypothetical protein [Bacillales bacterium]